MNTNPKNQQGAILIVTLVMLLLMTLLAIGSMRGTTLQERMAGNLRDESQAFQAAEMAQRHAEAVIQSKSVAEWQNVVTAQTGNAASVPDLGQATYTLTPLPGVTLRRAGESLQAGQAVTTSVIRIETKGLGASQDPAASSSGSPTASSAINISTLYIRR